MTRQGHAELVSASFSLIHATVESFFPLCHLDEAAEYLIVCMNAPPGKGPTLRNNNFRDQDSNYANSSFNYHLAQSGCPPPLSMWSGQDDTVNHRLAVGVRLTKIMRSCVT